MRSRWPSWCHALVVVKVDRASHEFVATFIWRDGRLGRVRVPNSAETIPGTFSVSGSLASVAAVDCDGEQADVLASVASPNAVGTWQISHRFLDFVGSAFEVTRTGEAQAASLEQGLGEVRTISAADAFANCRAD